MAVVPPGESFDDVVVRHLGAAGRLARWVMRNEQDAEDVVQEASLRAFRYFRTFRGGNGRAWFLRIVRNTCNRWRGRAGLAPTESFDDEHHPQAQPGADPERLLLQRDDAVLIARALNRLPDHLRELLVLRALRGSSYRELAEATGVPIGTVMSRLSRARRAFRAAFDEELTKSPAPEAIRFHGGGWDSRSGRGSLGTTRDRWCGR